MRLSRGVVHEIAAIGRREILMQVIHPHSEVGFHPLRLKQGSKAELHAQTAHIQQVVFPVIARNPVLVFRHAYRTLQIQIKPPVQFPCHIQVCSSHQVVGLQVVHIIIRSTLETGDRHAAPVYQRTACTYFPCFPVLASSRQRN